MKLKFTKVCTKCGIEKLLGEFHRKTSSRDGRNERCKNCRSEDTILWNEMHREQMRKCVRHWQKANPEKQKEATRNWAKNHPEKMREIIKRANKKRLSEPKGILSGRMSAGIRGSIRGNKRGRHWETLVNYSLDELKRHLEKQFIDEMSWENMGLWHIDHIIPISIFNFKTTEDYDFKRCWALKNLQPMWASENDKKHNKIEHPFQPSLM